MSKTYRHPAMKQLKDQQTRYAPKDRRLEQVERAEQSSGRDRAFEAIPVRVPLLSDHRLSSGRLAGPGS